MNNIQFCFIKKEYFLQHSKFINMLDTLDANKQSRRTHLCILVSIKSNKILIPLRNNLGEPLRKYGKIGYPAPSKKRPLAGLDYRHSLIINNDRYIEYHYTPKIPQTQYEAIANNYETIKKEITVYVSRYIKAARKGRQAKEPLFRNSSLANFHQELGI